MTVVLVLAALLKKNKRLDIAGPFPVFLMLHAERSGSLGMRLT